MAYILLPLINEAKKIYKVLKTFYKDNGLRGFLILLVIISFLIGILLFKSLSDILSQKHGSTPGSQILNQPQTQHQTVINNINVGQVTQQPSPTVTPVSQQITTTPTPTPDELGMSTHIDCSNKPFPKNTKVWDLSLYNLINGDGFYAPSPRGKNGYRFPPITYKASISAAFKEFSLHYMVRNIDKTSTHSASLYVSLHEFIDKSDERTVFYLNIPEPEPYTNMIELRTMDMTSAIPSIIQAPPIYLRYKMEAEVTDTIDLADIVIEADGMHYQLRITYVPEGGGQPITEDHDITVPPSTVKLSDKDYYLAFGVNNTGSIDPMDYIFCDIPDGQ